MRRKTALVAFLFAIATGIGVWYYVFHYSNTHRRDIANENAITTTANQIVKDFQTNEALANKFYLNKVIQIRGEVAQHGKDQSGNHTVTLKSDDPFSGVLCTIAKAGEPVKEHQIIVVRGICAGFLSDVVLNEAIIIQN